MKEKDIFFGTILALNCSHNSMYLKTRDATNAYLFLIFKKVHFADNLSTRTYFWDTAIPRGKQPY